MSANSDIAKAFGMTVAAKGRKPGSVTKAGEQRRAQIKSMAAKVKTVGDRIGFTVDASDASNPLGVSKGQVKVYLQGFIDNTPTWKGATITPTTEGFVVSKAKGRGK